MKTALAAFFLFGLPAEASYSTGDEHRPPSVSLIQTKVNLNNEPLSALNEDFLGTHLHVRPRTAVPGALMLALTAGMTIACRGGTDEVEEGDALPGQKGEEPWIEMPTEVAEKVSAEPRDLEYERDMELQYDQLWDTLQTYGTD